MPRNEQASPRVVRFGVRALVAAALGISCASWLVIGTAGADEAVPDQPAMWEHLRGQMKDPGSAYYRNARYVVNRKGDSVGNISFCGEINARNSYGGFVGFRPFIVNWMQGKGMFVWEGDGVALLYGPLCGTEPTAAITPEVTTVPDMAQP